MIYIWMSLGCSVGVSTQRKKKNNREMTRADFVSKEILYSEQAGLEYI